MSKLSQAEDLEKEAKKSTERSLFRWTPDWDTAAVKYEKAGAIYKSLQKDQKAIDCYVNAGFCHEKNGIEYSAGKNYELAGNILRDAKQFTDAVKWYKEASRIYLEGGKADRSSEVLIKAAKSLEKEVGAERLALELYSSAISSSTLNGKYHNATDLLRGYNTFLMKNKFYKECIENVEHQVLAYRTLNQPHNEYKAILSIVVLYLKLDDVVAAEDANNKYMQESNGYTQSEECDLAVAYVSAFSNRDEGLLERTKKNNALKFLEGPIAKVAMTMSLNPVLDDEQQERMKEQRRQLQAKKSTNSPSTTSSKKNITNKKAALFALDEDEEEEEEKPLPTKTKSPTTSSVSSSSSKSNVRPPQQQSPVVNQQPFVDNFDNYNNNQVTSNNVEPTAPIAPTTNTSNNAGEDDDFLNYVTSSGNNTNNQQQPQDDLDDYFTTPSNTNVSYNYQKQNQQEDDLFDPNDLT
ncbi:hypothetical protein ABK040_000889 [Willaertia magna]